MRLTLLPDVYAICRLEPGAAIPAWATAGTFFCITRTDEELSLLCAEEDVPQDVLAERGWRALRLEGPFPFELTGVLASILHPLAEAGVSILAVSTYHTDYVLVKAAQVERALAALTGAGHVIRR